MSENVLPLLSSRSFMLFFFIPKFPLEFELQVQLPGTEKWVFDSLWSCKRWESQKSYLKAVNTVRTKAYLFYLLGNAGWISLIKSCLCYYFLGTVRSNQEIITSQTSLYFTEKWQACFSLISQMKSRKYCVLKLHKLIHFYSLISAGGSVYLLAKKFFT